MEQFNAGAKKKQSPLGTQPAISFSVHSDIAAVAETWRSFQKHAAGGPHQTFEWVDAWLRAHPVHDEIKPQIVVGSAAKGQCVMILPLGLRRHMSCVALEWLGANQGNYSSGLFDAAYWAREDAPECRETVKNIIALLPGTDIMHLSHHPAALQGIANPLACLPGSITASMGYSFPLSPEWEKHYEVQFGASSRRELRRCERRLGDQGELHFNLAQTQEEKISALNTMIAQKRAQLSELGIHDFLGDKAMQRFYLDLIMRSESTAGPQAKLFTLSAGSEILATNLGLLHQRRFYGLISSTTNGAQRRLAPGNVLFRHIVEHLANENVTGFDCGAGENSHKLRWCTEKRLCYHAILPVTAKGWVYAARLASSVWLKERIKNSPYIWSLAQRLRSFRGRFFTRPDANSDLHKASSVAANIQA